jgi:hypothetical protein
MKHLYTHLPLKRAYLCPDCSEIGDNSRQCACCGWTALLYLEPILNCKATAITAADESFLRVYHIDGGVR